MAGGGVMTYTPKEMDIINHAIHIPEKHRWMSEHPGKTRRDFNALTSEAKMEWRRVHNDAYKEAERDAWLADHPNKTADDYERAGSCGATDDDVLLMRIWEAS